MRVLIIGGSHFFGKRLVQKLIDAGDDVTVLTRGNRPINFNGDYKTLKGDRTNSLELQSLVKDLNFDCIFDQACFDYPSAIASCEIFADKTKHYIFTSSQSVYGPGKNIKEESFDPSHHTYEKVVLAEENYAEAKRQTEVAFQKKAPFTTCFVRFPIVIGEDDQTGRFNWHLKRIAERKEIFFPNIDASISFIYAGDAAMALQKIAREEIKGSLNCCSPGPIKLRTMVEDFELFLGKKMRIAKSGNDTNYSPYGIKNDWYMDNTKAMNSGLSFMGPREVLKRSLENLVQA